MRRSRVLAAVAACWLSSTLAAGCRQPSGQDPPGPPPPSPQAGATEDDATASASVADQEPTILPAPAPATDPPAPPAPGPPPPAPAAPTPPAANAGRPAWLGTRPLPLRADGFGQVQATPEELIDRRLPPADALGPPTDGAFRLTIDPVPAEVVARSTWSPACPVALADLRYLTLTYWGFDERAHTGELLVAASAAEDLGGVFARLYEARFPIEQMLVVSQAELDAAPTGDGNTTAAFVCRPATGATGWSQHAYGLAVDLNPFHNPYERGDLVLPELASAYSDRTWLRPGMIVAGDVVTEAFAAIGWGWGGDWRSLTDRQHFSANGR